jgi:hypothetical protein
MHNKYLLWLLPASLFALAACSSGESSRPVVSFPADADPTLATPEFLVPTEDPNPDSPVMVEIKEIGRELDAAIRAEALALGLSQATLSSETLEKVVKNSEWSDVASVEGGRVQVTKGGESICLLLGGDQEKPAFLEERTCL